jgi:hypothetical protein
LDVLLHAVCSLCRSRKVAAISVGHVEDNGTNAVSLYPVNDRVEHSDISINVSRKVATYDRAEAFTGRTHLRRDSSVHYSEVNNIRKVSILDIHPHPNANSMVQDRASDLESSNESAAYISPQCVETPNFNDKKDKVPSASRGQYLVLLKQDSNVVA